MIDINNKLCPLDKIKVTLGNTEEMAKKMEVAILAIDQYKSFNMDESIVYKEVEEKLKNVKPDLLI